MSLSKKIRNLWRVAFVITVWAVWHARNRAVHDDVPPTHHGTMTTILSLIREAQHFKLGTMHGVNDLLICRRLRVPAIPRSPRITIVLCWKPPPPSCYKLNVDRSVSEG